MPSAQTPPEALEFLARAWRRERRRVLADPAPEAIHRLRTAARRIEIAAVIASSRLGLIGPVPWSDWSQLQTRLSRLRDLDVTLDLLRDTRARLEPDADDLRRKIRDLAPRRRRLRRRVIAALRRRRVGRVAAAVKDSSGFPPLRASGLRPAARAWWAETAGRSAREAAWEYSLPAALRLKSGRKSIHAVRVAIRELRYGLEWWDRLGIPASPPTVTFLRNVQEALGRIRDLQRATKALDGREFGPARALLLGALRAESVRWRSLAAERGLLGSSPFTGSGK